MQFELIDLQESSEARAAYRDNNLIGFYKGLSPSTYPALCQHAVRMVSLFGSTYICEKTLPTMAINKSKLRSRLTDGHLHVVLRITTTRWSRTSEESWPTENSTTNPMAIKKRMLTK
ncbi:General transcription factor II-I repeat domain-containing protein 2B [Merluccius polli]|uniref:General transcription factor II-I repeat domain-containing protein 2B n=1 Tax=Merluccius polli TaxID=89951 RepID=A0AA47NT71_MERPO|nr:General transcription factor II-I repeat domain-containing protein 2B [Merluccius polli]